MDDEVKRERRIVVRALWVRACSRRRLDVVNGDTSNLSIPGAGLSSSRAYVRYYCCISASPRSGTLCP
jgi:hypothetical protein